tara:strand:- start:1571 stop:4555 length:2985 start_codon:yes stop_codon:yes gene_type:complete
MGKISKLVALTLLMSFALSQTTGKIRGTVTSADGQPLAGANVIVDGTAKGAATDGDGKYTILNVEAGTYSVTASYIGYQSSTSSNVSIKVDLTTPLNFSMQASAIEGEAVTIIGQKRLIEKSATNSVRSIGDQEIRNSASRSVVGVLDLQPGVNITNGRISVRGSRSEEVAYTLDGASITDVINTGFEFSAIPEALAEISVEAGGYGAHIGGANSGVIRQTLRTGSNEVGGDVRFETGDFGLTDLTATVNVPIGNNIKTFLALSSRHVDDWDPTYYKDFSINNGALLESTVSGSTPDGDSIAVNFNSGGKDGITHRAKDDLKINATAVVDLGPLNLRVSGVVDNQTREFNGLPIYNMFNTDRLGESNRKLSMMNLRANYFVNPTMLVSAGVYTLNRKYEYYDGAFGSGDFAKAVGYFDSTTIAAQGVDASYWAGGNTDFAIAGNTYQNPSPYYVANTFAFARPGSPTTGWGMSQRNSFGFDLGVTWQRGDHEIRAGIDYKKYTYRSYNLSTSAMYNLNANIADDKYTFDEVVSGESVLVTNDLSVFNRFGQIGYDDYGKEIDDDWDGPREPSVTSFYVNDKFEAGDLVISAGVRFDNFMMDDWRMKDPANPGWDQSNQGIIESEFLESETKSIIQPRLGLAFPVSDEVVFHLQYGKFAQMPELDLPYASTRYMNLVWGGQNYTPDPMGFDLDPIETTQYEVGMSYQVLPSAAIDITAFAKNTTGQVVVGKNEEVGITNTNNVARDAFYYKNGDFTTVNGFEFTLRTRRVSRLQSFASYSWSDARGINSDPNTGAGNIAQDLLSPPPLMISPLYYHNKHRGAVALDYRYGQDDGLLSGLGFNFEYKFNSGHPFTYSDGGMGQRSADAGALLADARSREPQESIGSSTTPWQYYANLKVDYNMSLGGVGVTLFAYVTNLFDRKNVINVYSRSGNAYDDGFLTDPALSSEIVAANGQTYVDLYRNVNLENRQHYMSDFGLDVFATPQIVKMGVAVNF